MPPINDRMIECLVIEDDPAMCDMLCSALADMGVETTSCFDTAGLAKILSNHNPGILFLDIGLRNCDALDIYATLSEQEYNGVVQLVSSRDVITLEHIRRAGEALGLRMRKPLGKPFQLADIETTLREEKIPFHPPPSPKHQPDSLVIDKVSDFPLRTLWINTQSGDPACLDLLASEGIETRAARLRAHINRWFSWRLERIYSDEFPALPKNLLIRTCITSLAPSTIRAILGGIRFSVVEPTLTFSFDENDIFSDLVAAREVILRLRIHGVQVRIENCGTRYIGMAGHEAFPVQEIIMENPLRGGWTKTGARRLRTITQIAHRANVKVMANVTASGADLDWLMDAGFDLCLALPDFSRRKEPPSIELSWRKVSLSQLFSFQQNIGDHMK